MYYHLGLCKIYIESKEFCILPRIVQFFMAIFSSCSMSSLPGEILNFMTLSLMVAMLSGTKAG
jgi:hypothetical protein